MESTSSRLLRLPLEIRDEIYSHLVFPEHVFASLPKHSNAQSLQSVSRSSKIAQAHVDARIYVPARPCTNVLRVCSQLREEYLDFYTREINSLQHKSVDTFAPEDSTTKVETAEADSTSLDDFIERARDEGCVRITLEIQRMIRGNMGGYMPARDTPSPRFLAMTSTFGRLKKIKFLAWSAWTWWTGPPKRSTTNCATSATAEVPFKPDDLTLAIEKLLKHLPLVEEMDIDLLLHEYCYWNWDLPDDRWEGIQYWLDSSIMPPEHQKLRRVYRRLLECEGAPPARAAIFYHQLEEKDTNPEGKAVVHVSRGSGQVRPSSAFVQNHTDSFRCLKSGLKRHSFQYHLLPRSLIVLTEATYLPAASDSLLLPCEVRELYGLSLQSFRAYLRFILSSK